MATLLHFRLELALINYFKSQGENLKENIHMLYKEKNKSFSSKGILVNNDTVKNIKKNVGIILNSVVIRL